MSTSLSSSASLGAARDAVRSEDFEAAMGHLLRAWRAVQACALADVIQELDVRLARPQIAGALGSADYEKSWLERAEKASASEVGRFACEIDRVTRLEGLLEHLPDPRLSAAVASILSDLRPAFADDPEDTRELWIRCAEVVERLQDPGLLTLRDAKAPWNGDWNVGGMALRLAVSLDALERRFPNGAPGLDAQAQDVVCEIRDMLRPSSVERRRKEEQELLASIYAAPRDDGPRQVYADWLLEGNDARGEFVQLQLQATAVAGAAVRCRQLLDRAREQWVGPLAPVLSSPAFRRGFVVAGQLDWKHRGNLERLASHPAWATVEEVTFAPEALAGSMPQHLDARVARSLRCVRRAGETGVASLCAAGEAWSLEVLSVAVRTPSCRQRLTQTLMLPKLKTLELLQEVSSASLSWLWKARLRLRLETLVATVRGRRDVWKVQMEASRLPELQTLQLSAGPLMVTLTRGPEQRLTRAELGLIEEGGASPESLLELLEMAPEYAFTHLEIRAALSGVQLQRLDDAAARQRGLDDIVIIPP